jgi:hypothetical protein
MKRGAVTMKYLLTLILAAVLLVLIIYGVQTKGFGPLWDSIEGKYNEALIFLGFRDSGIPSCGDAFDQDIDGIGGRFYPCEDSCTFALVSPTSLLGFSNFSIDKNGFSVISKEGIKDYDKAYVFDSVEAQRHRDAYDFLNEIVREFLASEGMDEKDFFNLIEVDRGRGVVFETKQKEHWYSLEKTVFYQYYYTHGGSIWKEVKKAGNLGDGKYDFLILGDVSRGADEVFGKVYSSYKDGDAYLITREIYDPSFRVEAGHGASMGEDEFRNWFDEVAESFDRDMSLHYGLSSGFNEFLSGRSADVLGEQVSVERRNRQLDDGQSFVEIYFFLPLAKEGYGIYYKDGEIVHVYHDALMYDHERSPVSDFVGLPDDKWEEFVKINDIYEYFKLRRCMAE